ncbi:hypothetical protein ACFLQN_00760 [Candidatus Aenigmatarchaeota archaeon]
MVGAMLSGLSKNLFDDRVTPSDASRFLSDAEDPTTTYETAPLFGNSNPRPPTETYFDHNLTGTGTLAWYLDPLEVEDAYPAAGRELRRLIGPNPIMAYNPDVAKRSMLYGENELLESIDDHEKTHGAQQAKQHIKRIGARTQFGTLPIGEMIIEGSVEYALDRRHTEMSRKGRRVAKAPSRYFDRRMGRSTYGIYREFVYDLEGLQKGVTRRVFKAAERGGANAVLRTLQSVKGIDRLISKYALELTGASRLN